MGRLFNSRTSLAKKPCRLIERIQRRAAEMIKDIMELVLGEQLAEGAVYRVPARGNSMLFTTKSPPSDELLNRAGGAEDVN